MKTLVWAHRGASAYAPENTMPAFELGAKMGADGFETDVRIVKDGELVLSHDDNLARVSNGSGLVEDKTLAELQKLDFSNGMPGFSNVKIATMRELFTFVKEHHLTVNIEVKYAETRQHELNEKLAAMAAEFDIDDQIVYSSFHEAPLLRLKKLVRSKVLLLYSIDPPSAEPWEYAKAKGLDGLNPHFSIVNILTAVRCQENGILLSPWTIDEEEHLAIMFAMHPHAVISNKPDVALRIRDGK